MSLKVRAHVDQALRRGLIEKQVHVYAASGGAISMLDAEQRLLLEPTVAQHSLSLLRTKVLGVHPKDGSSPAVGWRAMPTDIYLQRAQGAERE